MSAGEYCDERPEAREAIAELLRQRRIVFTPPEGVTFTTTPEPIVQAWFWLRDQERDR